MHKTLFVAILLTSLFLSPLVVFAQTSTLRVKVNIAPELSLVVRSTPAGARAGSQLSGAEGTVIGSPQIVGGKTWQQVDFDSGIDGWVASSYLQSVGSVTPPPPPPPPPPAQVAIDCPQGELPLLRDQGYEEGGQWGRDGVPIADGETHTYCFTVNEDQRRIILGVIDDTGAAQCTWHNSEFIPPAGSGWETQMGQGRITSASFRPRSGSVPRGVWRIRTTSAETPNCNDRYRLIATH